MGPALGREVVVNLAPRHVEPGTDSEAVGRDPCHPSDGLGAAGSENPEEDGLRLVVTSVCKQNTSSRGLPPDALEGGMAKVTQGRFVVPRRIESNPVDLETEAGDEARQLGRNLRRPRPTVVDVGHDRALPDEALRNPQQGHGITPAGASHDHAGGAASTHADLGQGALATLNEHPRGVTGSACVDHRLRGSWRGEHPRAL